MSIVREVSMSSKICYPTKSVHKSSLKVWRSITGKQKGVYEVAHSFEQEESPNCTYIKFEECYTHVNEADETITQSTTSMFQYVPQAFVEAALQHRNAPRREEIDSDEGNCSNSNSSGSSENIDDVRNREVSEESDYESNFNSSQEHIPSETENTHL